MDYLVNTLNILLLVLGFGFVIFWHELGHFLAAKWVGIRVEQFAVGMGHAICSWRRGIGLKWGNSRAEFERRIREHLGKKLGRAPSENYSEREINEAADELGLGETEYRLSWIPVGGYVKMLGQDDLDPASRSDDPRAYNKKTVAQRMLVISAGVIMNIILAGILFMVLFMYGFNAPAPVAGNVQPGSPAQLAQPVGIRPGDRIVAFGDQVQHDFTKISLNTALASPNEPLLVKVRRHDSGVEEVLSIQPVKPDDGSKAFLAMGFSQAPYLGARKKQDFPKSAEHPDLEAANLSLRPGDVVTAVNGKPTTATGPKDVAGGAGDWALFDRELQEGWGKPVVLTVRRADGKVEAVEARPYFMAPFGPKAEFNVAGMRPRARVQYISKKESPVFGKLTRGDVVESITVHAANSHQDDVGTLVLNPSPDRFREITTKAGQDGHRLDFVVLRGAGERHEVKGIRATLKLEDGKRGIGIAPGHDDANAVVAEVIPDSPAARAGIVAGSRITAVDGKAVASWFDLSRALGADGKAGERTLTVVAPNVATPATKTLALSDAEVKELTNMRVMSDLVLGELTEVRKTGNPVVALGWGVTETRDLILQFYVTLKRVFSDRTVSPKNFMGPLGIFDAGAKFAFKGTDWLIWFLAMISANLAVVNFLPIPIVDGGHFVFLLIEKIQGRPPSRRVLETAQLVGLFFIIGVFLLVTYNDISRMFGG